MSHFYHHEDYVIESDVRRQLFIYKWVPVQFLNRGLSFFEEGEYCIYANTDGAGWDFAMRKPVQSFKDQIKSCWKRGVNPRVYNPFLPAGLEEKLGLDYFGGEKAK